MPNIFTKLKNRLTSSSGPSKAKSTGDINLGASTSSLAGSAQCYIVKEKELPKLHYAAWKGNLDKVIELSRPDKINSRDKEDRTPLHLAVAANHLSVSQHLLSEDAKLQVFDKDNRSPLILAVLNSSVKMMDLLVSYLDQKNLINIPDRNGLNVLFYAIKVQNGLPILKLLLQKNLVNKSLVDKDKNTALHFATIQKNYEAINLLLENEMDADARNADGRTSLMLASLSGDERITEYLLEYNADKMIKDNSGRTAIDYAAQSRNEKCVALLQEERLDSARTLSDVENETDSANIVKGEKKFENLFTKKNQSPQKDFGSRSLSALKYQTDDDDQPDSQGSNEPTEEKIVLSHDKSDRGNSWTNSEEEDDENQESVVEKEYNNIFSSIQLKENKLESLDPIAGAGSFVNSKAENEEEKEEEDEWPDMPSTASLQKKFKNNNNQPTFSTFFPKSKNKENDESTDGVSNWAIFVITGDVKNAGTDANVHIQIYGTRCASAQIPLERKKNNKKLFESGNCDKFEINLPEIGKPLKIKIGHDSKGSFPGWFLDNVVLQNNITNEKFLFNCNRWLAKDKLDHKIELELSVDGNESNKLQLESSSWNSSEDEDDGEESISLESTKKSSTTTPKSNILKMIQEEKLNSKDTSFFSSKIENSPAIKKSEQFAQKPPEISDFEDSTDERSPNNTPMKTAQLSPTQGAVSFLAKSMFPTKEREIKKNETIGQLFAKSNQSTPQHKASSIEISDAEDKSINELINSAELFFDDKKKNETVKALIITSGFNSPTGSNNSPNISKLLKNDQKTAKQSSVLADRIKNRQSLSIDDDFSDNKSQSIGDLIATVNNIIDKPKPKSPLKDSEEISFKDMVRNEMNQGILSNKPIPKSPLKDSEEFSFKDMVRNEMNQGKLSDKSKPKSPLKVPEEISFKDMVRNEMNEGSFFEISPLHNTKITTSSSSPANTTGLSSLLKAQQASQKQNDNTLMKIAQLDEEENKAQDIHLSTLLSNELNKPNNFFKSPFKETSSKKQSNNKFNISSFNDSDDESNIIQDDDDDGNFDSQFEFKKSPSKVSETIGTAIGSIVANSSMVQVSNRPKSKNSFANVAADLYESASVKSISPDQLSSFSNGQNLKSKQHELQQIKQLLDEMRRKNDELSSEKQHLKLQLADTESKKNNYEQICSEKERQLAEKEQQIFELNTYKQKSEIVNKLDSNDNKLLQKEIRELREKNHDLESKLSATRVAGIVASTAAAVDANQNFLRLSDDLANQPILQNQNESLNVKVKALEAQIEELNKDREQLIIYKEDLYSQLNEKENDVTNQNEALKRASLQFLMEKNVLNDENLKAKHELTELVEIKKRLNVEIDNLKTELTDKKMKFEQLNMTKLSLEQHLDREKNDHEKHLRTCDAELRSTKEQLVKLNEKLSITEAKLISTENDYKYTKLQIEDRQKQINELKDELVKNKADFALHLELFRKEKQEKETLLKKCDSLEESIKKNVEEVSFWKKKHQRSLALEQNNTQNNGINIDAEFNDPSLVIELENRKLQNDVKVLNEKLEKAEKELNDIREENENIKTHVTRTAKKSHQRSKSNTTRPFQRNQSDFDEPKRNAKKKTHVRRDSSASSSSSSSATASSASSNENAKIKSELKNLRNDFNSVMSKFTNDPQLQHNSMNQDYQVRNQGISRPQRENVDVPGLITDLPLKTVANLNNYLIKNIIRQEQEPDNLHIITSSNNPINSYRPTFYSHEPTTHLILTRKNNMYATSTDIPSVNDLMPTTPECNQCFQKSKSYIDSLKYELSKRIEFEANRDVPFTDSYRHNSTNNFDSLYNRLNENSSNSRLLSTQNNTDLLNSLRLKFLI